MDKPQEQLRPLGLQPGWIYEAVVCTFLDGGPHAAPAGVRTVDGATLRLDLYDTSQTLRAITATGVFVVDFPRDAAVLFAASHAPEDLSFVPAHAVAAPRLAHAGASVELMLAEAQPDGGLTHVRGSVAHVEAEPGLRLLNRAEPLLVEGLIVASRVGLYGRDETLERLHEYRRVIDKVAPGSTYSNAMARLVHELAVSS